MSDRARNLTLAYGGLALTYGGSTLTPDGNYEDFGFEHQAFDSHLKKLSSKHSDMIDRWRAAPAPAASVWSIPFKSGGYSDSESSESSDSESSESSDSESSESESSESSNRDTESGAHNILDMVRSRESNDISGMIEPKRDTPPDQANILDMIEPMADRGAASHESADNEPAGAEAADSESAGRADNVAHDIWWNLTGGYETIWAGLDDEAYMAEQPHATYGRAEDL